MSAPTVLDRIIVRKRVEVAAALRAVPEGELRARIADAPPPRPFRAALESAEGIAVVAELKRRSPSAGPIRPDLAPVEVAEAYRAGGAAALSILTDSEDFGGSLDMLAEVRAAVPLPVLRKEFVVSEYQVLEARAWGADAVLLIAGVLGPRELSTFAALARSIGMEALAEVHTADELDLVKEAAIPELLLGINNRDLKLQETRLSIFEELAPAGARLSGLLVAESGIATAADAARMRAAGARALLVGESLLRAADPAAALRALREGAA
ncbi:MAG: indole-3-glycerol phosphate synthase TrpC [Candidatus Sumerlaeia bacterium]|nr:indole-3-glycerol phosphate synthase TrpC [Candidatus Sumerlaeia bacterium]